MLMPSYFESKSIFTCRQHARNFVLLFDLWTTASIDFIIKIFNPFETRQKFNCDVRHRKYYWIMTLLIFKRFNYNDIPVLFAFTFEKKGKMRKEQNQIRTRVFMYTQTIYEIFICECERRNKSRLFFKGISQKLLWTLLPQFMSYYIPLY